MRLSLLITLFAWQDPWSLTDPKAAAGGFATGQVLYDAFMARFGDGLGGAIVLSIFLVAMLMCAP